MRLWSIHPQYLDAKGLVALWREGLLAKKVLENKTKGYRNHPQLDRFKESGKALFYIKIYLHEVCDEAEKRGYCFDRTKLGKRNSIDVQLSVNSGQVKYEWEHLMRKLKVRSPHLFKEFCELKKTKIHPLFKRKKGEIESWEIT